MKEFTGIFKTDPISEKFIKLFKDKLMFGHSETKEDKGQPNKTTVI